MIGVGLLAGFVVVEIVARLAFADAAAQMRLPAYWFEPSDIPGVPFVLRPNAEGWTNNLGLRMQSDVSIERTPGAFRLLVVGDSVTAISKGETSANQLYSNRLQEPLSRHLGKAVEVLTLASPGLSLAQDLALLRARGLRLRPDLVMIAYAFNDPIRTDIVEAANIDRFRWLRSAQLLQQRLYESESATAPEQWYRSGSKVYRRLDATFADLSRLAATQRIVVVPLPLSRRDAAEQLHLPVVAELCRRHGLHHIDIYPDLAPYLASLTPEQSSDGLHFDAAGHRAVAEALLEPLAAMILRDDGP